MKNSIQKLQAGIGRIVAASVLSFGLVLGAGQQTATAQESIGDPLWLVQAGTVDFLTAAGNQVRGIAYNPATGNLLVASRADGDSRIEVLNAETGESIGRLPDPGFTGGTLVLNRIAVSDDGQIFAVNLILEANTGFKVYYWENEEATPRVVYDGKPTPDHRYGDGIGVTGTGSDVQLMVSGTFTPVVSIFEFDGDDFNPEPTVVNMDADRANGSIVAVPGTSYAWVSARDQKVAKINLETEEIIAEIPADILPLSFGDVAYISDNGREYLLAGVEATENHNFKLLDVTNPNNVVVLAETGSITFGENQFRVAGVSIDKENKIGYVLATNVAIAAFDLSEAMAIEVSVEEPGTIPVAFNLEQNFPNPFNPTTSITFSLTQSSHVQLSVYNLLGQQVATLVNGVQPAGSQTVNFNAAGLSSGTYIYRLETAEGSLTRTMTLVK